MRTVFLLVLFLFPFVVTGRSEPSAPQVGDFESIAARRDTAVVRRFERAYAELAGMLDGHAPLSLKRAVFLVEWAASERALDYDAFNAGIDTAARAIERFMRANGLYAYRTGGNAALFEYFTRPYAMNGYRPFAYDFDHYRGDEDLSDVFVSKLMRTHLGQCRSLPLYYKLLADEIGAEAYIAYAPFHSFIRHRDEADTCWLNFEPTNGSFPRDAFIIETCGITAEAVEKGTYMKPCGNREIVLELLTDLAQFYQRRVCSLDPVVWRCLETVLRHRPDLLRAMIVLHNCWVIAFQEHRRELMRRRLPDDERIAVYVSRFWELRARIDATGHIEPSDSARRAIYDTIEQERERRRGLSDAPDCGHVFVETT
ncbi:MAG: hypothetical protein K2G58_06045 [Alistipes sp.]|nr:hypothetical protein [Alistipes sp.]